MGDPPNTGCAANRVPVALGPVAGGAARAWLANTRRIIDAVRARAHVLPFSVPGEVMAAFDRYLDSWTAASRADGPFEWRGEVDVDELRMLAHYWFNIDSLNDEQLARLGVQWSGPEGEPFFLAVTDAMLGVLTSDPEAAPFANRLAGAWVRSSG